MAEFHIESFQNPFLPQGVSTMHAVLTVTASATGSTGSGDAAPEDRSELIIVDTSGSMNGAKLRSVKTATSTAIDCIPDGVRFGIITGNHEAEIAFPAFPPLVVSSAQTRADAKKAVTKFEAGGGTAMGSWIELAAYILGDSSGIRHAILLTDGKNESEEPEDLDRSLRAAEGIFQCDCRGVGANWVVAELRKVATALLGTYDIVANPEGLAVDFSSMMMESLRKQVAEVTLRVWTPQNAQVVALKQMDPPLDLTDRRTGTAPLVGDYATGSWGDESRDYYLSVRVPAGDIDDEMLAARVTLMIGEEQGPQCLVRAVWTDDAAKSTRMNNRVAEALGESELADAIQVGIDALRDGDDSSATRHLAKAVSMAKDAGNDEALERLKHVVDEDPITGRVRPKPKVEDIDLLTLETRSTRTSRTSKPMPPDSPSPPNGPPPGEPA